MRKRFQQGYRGPMRTAVIPFSTSFVAVSALMDRPFFTRTVPSLAV